ncbi:hypothetical protein EYR36_005878 [Pleurotus pulmonarius]|nr:hypothetical protein EYR36_005878 [Pleurotus pulmonarius]
MPIIYPRESSATSQPVTSATPASSGSTTLAGPGSSSISPTSASRKIPPSDTPLSQSLTSSTADETGTVSSVQVTSSATKTATSTNTTLSQASSQPSQSETTPLPPPLTSDGSSLHAVDSTTTTPSTRLPISSALTKDNAAEKDTPSPEKCLRRRRRSSFNIRSYQPTRDIEVHVASSTAEEKVDVTQPNQEEIFPSSLHGSNSNQPASTEQSRSHSPHSYDLYQPRAISTDDVPVYTHHIHSGSIASTDSRYASATSTPYSGMAQFASPATTLTSVVASPQTRRSRFGPSWHYSPRAPPRSASRTSNKLQDARDALLRATWKGHMLSTLLEGDARTR